MGATPQARHGARHNRVTLTREAVLVDGRPTIPVSGEIHYSRLPRSAWDERLRLLRSGGVTIASTYVFWNHHQPRLDTAPDFTGNRDLAAFVRACAAAGLFAIVRIGPWAHGEARYGGLPDEVATAEHPIRTDDPQYLALVERWWRQLAEHLAPVLGPDGPIVGVQIENELIDDPEHIASLAGLARRLGITAPIVTATAWMGARLPTDEVMPLYGGYSDGFWLDPDEGWHPSFREHFFFSHVWDDPGIGADVTTASERDARGTAAADVPVPGAHYPIATCELGGGMATAYHRRPWPSALDVAAVGTVKLGNGSQWQGYYMAVGGVNPAVTPGADSLEESHRTGYPNELPRVDYDFHAPIGAAGMTRGSHALLRQQNAMLEAFGARLAGMHSVLPDDRPRDLDDRGTVRWASRTDGEAALAVVSWHQPHEPLPTLSDVQLPVPLGDSVEPVPALPVALPPGTLARWPVRWPIGAQLLRSASASLLTELPGDEPMTVLQAHDGVPVLLAVEPGVSVTGEGVRAVGEHPGMWVVDASRSRLATVGEAGDAARMLVLSPDDASAAWVLSTARGRELYVSGDDLWVDADGGLVARAVGRIARARRFDPDAGAWAEVRLQPAEPGEPWHAELAPRLVRVAGDAPPHYGYRERRPSAPTPADRERLGAEWSLELPADASDPDDLLLTVDWRGDVAELLVDGRVVCDRFWDGSPWQLRLREWGVTPDSRCALRIVPLHPRNPVHLPVEAQALRDESEPLLGLDRVTVATVRRFGAATP
ncbi:MAG: beta-galactosidase [Microcella sp.]